MDSILNVELLKSQFVFTKSVGHNSMFRCNCGHCFSVEQEGGESTSTDVVDLTDIDEHIEAEMESLYQSIKMAEMEVLKCDSCGSDLLSESNIRNTVNENKNFASGFKTIDDEKFLYLYYAKTKPVCIEDGSNFDFDLIESHKYLKLDKESKMISFKDFGKDEVDVDLNDVVEVVGEFFDNDIQIIMNVYELHTFLNLIAGHVIDIENIDIINGLLEHVKNRINDIGVEPIKKVISIFFGIIKYSNLSTVALTKGPNFLYDLMVECEIPDSKTMLESGATSPIKIFNFLTGNYIKKLDSEIEEDDKESYEFVYKSTKKIEIEEERELSKAEEEEYLKSGEEEEIEYKVIEDGEERQREFKFNINKNYKKNKVRKAGGAYQILDSVKDGSISKLVYKNITNFSDYKQLIKYLRLVDKNQLIELIQKYDLKLLLGVIDNFYFRNFEKGFKEIKRLLDIIKSYVYYKSCEIYPNLNGVDMHWELISGFDYFLYDDSLMMVELIGFDRRKHFDKLRDYESLCDYHENMAIYSSLAMISKGAETPEEIADREARRAKFEAFISKFLFLDDRSDYDGPLEFELHKDPARMIREGREMRHSGHSYTPKVVQGLYLMGSLYDNSIDIKPGEPNRFTVGFKYNERDGLEFDELKTFENALAPDRVKNLFVEFLTVKDISFRGIKDLKVKDSSSGLSY